MTIEELKTKLEALDVPQTWYSINDSVKPGAYILWEIHGFYDCFYFDERGNECDRHRFMNENDACEYLYNSLYNRFRRFQRT